MTKPILRCAIYTRVSSDQGLEQDFNSLHAQREAAEAYIKSQAHEGWKLRRDRYDDGGFSGGSMERPALQQLLADVRAGRIDIVVVYKVDRLTRSLADFAKLVELFDAHKVSFVSVTQSFNTTSSMGRLTLNVLLSFAQFEREVTGERIRDKIAASKRKGIWMGGVVPLGYRVEARKLLVEEAEATTVRLIFERYLALGSLTLLRSDLRDRGIRSRARQLASGQTRGGVTLTNGPLAHILKNRFYLGELNHKGKSFPAEHAPIVPVELFEAVQTLLAERRQHRGRQGGSSNAILKGRLFDERGNRMTPSHALKAGVRYRYYIAHPILQGRRGDAGTLQRISASAIEAVVIEAVRQQISNQDNATSLTDAALIEARDVRVTIGKSQLEIAMSIPTDAETRSAKWESDADLADEDQSRRTFFIAWAPVSARRRREIIMPTAAAGVVQPIRRDEQAKLLRAIAQSRRWMDELIEGTCTDIAALAYREKRTERSVRMTLSLAFLDPMLVKAAAEGRLPRGYGSSRLVDLPMHWPEQWQALGLRRPA